MSISIVIIYLRAGNTEEDNFDYKSNDQVFVIMTVNNELPII
jgi:hypothetical protein